jgi:hypothetical protein
MKKILLIIVLLVAIPSCSIEDETMPQTTSVAISTGEEFNSNTTEKNVQRGTLFAWISEMQIKATHQSGYVSTTDFTLVANGTSGASTKFTMDNVLTGNNTFTASSKTTVTGTLETAQFTRPSGTTTSPTNSTIVGQFNTLKARNPYALYTSTNPVNATIVLGTAQNVVIPMKTDNSRIITMFTTDENSSTNTVTITCYVNGAVFGPSATCNRTKNATFYWSDKDCLAGKSVVFRIVNKNNYNVTLETYNTPPIVIRASNTLKMLYTVNSNKTVTIRSM